MVLRGLAGRDMHNERILEILKRISVRYNADILKASYKDFDLELIVLIDGSEEAKDGICADMNAILTGYMNPDTLGLIDCTLEIDDVCCPNTTVTSNEVLYDKLVKCKKCNQLC